MGQFLHPISPVQSSRSIKHMQTVQLFLNRILILSRQFGCKSSLCFTDQETQEENFRVESAPLWASSYTHLLYKAQDPFSLIMKTVQSFLNIILILCGQFGSRITLCFTDQETKEENLQAGTSSLVDKFVHPISLVQCSRSIQCKFLVENLLKQTTSIGFF